MDLRLSDVALEFDLQERWREAERLRVQTDVPRSGRIVSAITAGLGHLLVRAGTRLETVADQPAANRSPALTTGPGRGYAN